MVLGQSKYAIGRFLLMIFLALKIMGVHAFTHAPEDCLIDEKCEFCDHFLKQNHVPLINATITMIPEVSKTLLFEQLPLLCHDNYYNKILAYISHNKPPPSPYI